MALSATALAMSKGAGRAAARLAQVNAGAGGLSLHGYQKAYLMVIDSKTMGISSSGAVSYTNKLYCQFNPASITIAKEVSWEASGGEGDGGEEAAPQPNRNAPELEFKGGGGATFSLELLFDTTDQPPGTTARDVRRYTNDLLALTLGEPKQEKKTEAEEVEAPKPVIFGWGDFELFQAVITKVEISFIMFDPDGKPVRATAAVEFLEYAEKPAGSQNPTTRTEPRKTWIVEQGQSLQQIAYAEYGHPGHWRHLADSNDLLNPLKLQPGQVLILPPLA
ncbi:MAG: LysM peptidoglycan-binding domain-containing protein [Anaerolineae bacterium]|nr:LysM peptidoglycan-binding domain-containing protein [Anaerolineae bacterium]